MIIEILKEYAYTTIIINFWIITQDSKLGLIKISASVHPIDGLSSVESMVWILNENCALYERVQNVNVVHHVPLDSINKYHHFPVQTNTLLNTDDDYWATLTLTKLNENLALHQEENRIHYILLDIAVISMQKNEDVDLISNPSFVLTKTGND